jgi:hypothetical protein
MKKEFRHASQVNCCMKANQSQIIVGLIGHWKPGTVFGMPGGQNRLSFGPTITNWQTGIFGLFGLWGMRLSAPAILQFNTIFAKGTRFCVVQLSLTVSCADALGTTLDIIAMAVAKNATIKHIFLFDRLFL